MRRVDSAWCRRIHIDKDRSNNSLTIGYSLQHAFASHNGSFPHPVIQQPSFSPVEAPEGQMQMRSNPVIQGDDALTVGLPRESRISMARISFIFFHAGYLLLYEFLWFKLPNIPIVSAVQKSTAGFHRLALRFRQQRFDGREFFLNS